MWPIEKLFPIYGYSVEDPSGGAADPSKEGSTGGEKSESGDAPQTITVAAKDGSTKQVSVEDAANLIANQDSLVNERVETAIAEAKQNLDLQAEQKAQEKINDYFAKMKKDDPEKYALVVGEGKGSKLTPTTAPAPKVDIPALPNMAEVDTEDPAAVALAFKGIETAFNTLKADRDAQAEALAKLGPLGERLKDFSPDQLADMVKGETDKLSRVLGPEIAEQVFASIERRTEHKGNLAAAREQAKELVEAAYPVSSEEIKGNFATMIYRNALYASKFYDQTRLEAVRKGDENPPAKLPLSRFIIDAAKEQIEPTSAMGEEQAWLHVKTGKTLPSFATPVDTGESEKEFDTPREALDDLGG